MPPKPSVQLVCESVIRGCVALVTYLRDSFSPNAVISIRFKNARNACDVLIRYQTGMHKNDNIRSATFHHCPNNCIVRRLAR